MRFPKLIMVVTVSFFMLTLLVGLSATTAQAQVVKWKQIVGLREAGNPVGSGTGEVTGGGQPLSTKKGNARVNLGNGNLRFKVKGLVLAGGDSIGTPGAITQVKGTLVCDTDGSAGGGNSTLVDTPLVKLKRVGRAEFQGDVGPLPAACDEPDIAFLIRTATDVWIANGAVRKPL